MRVIAAEEEVLTRLVVVGSSTSPNATEQEATLGTQTVESVRFKPSAVYALYLLLWRVIALPSPSTPTLASRDARLAALMHSMVTKVHLTLMVPVLLSTSSLVLVHVL